MPLFNTESVRKHLVAANVVRDMERLMFPHLGEIHFLGHTVEWGKDMTPDEVARAKNGEAFVLVKDGKAKSIIFKDGYGNFREKPYDGS